MKLSRHESRQNVGIKGLILPISDIDMDEMET